MLNIIYVYDNINIYIIYMRKQISNKLSQDKSSDVDLNDPKFYTLSTNETLNSLKVEKDFGLSNSEVERRKKKYGLNKLRDSKKKNLFIRFLEQFKDVMILVLLAAVVISFVVAGLNWEIEGAIGLVEPFIILLIVFVNAIIGLVQQQKAEKSLEALKKMTVPKTTVLRDGKKIDVLVSELVPGDIVYLEAGDFVPADGRIIESNSLRCIEASLTGESVPVEKYANQTFLENTMLADRTNVVYSSCSVIYGSAIIVVTEIGMKTEIGKIAAQLEQAKSEITPLQKRLNFLGKILALICLIVCAIMLIVGIVAYHMPIMESVMTAISLAVAAIPEGLAVVVTVILSIGVNQMVKHNAIVKNLTTVETLGSTSIICSDKTGTLTQNVMTVISAYDGKESENISENNSEKIKHLLELGTLCNNGDVQFKEGKEILIGDPTETSIISAAIKNKINVEKLLKKYPRVAEIPFDSERKLMTTINKIDGKYIAIVKGAFDSLYTYCKKGDLKKAKEINDEYSNQALRVIGIAIKEFKTLPKVITAKTIEKDLSFIGLIGMIDPPRPEVKKSIEECKQAGIKTIMITGDHVLTAQAIAKQLGIFSENDIAITGLQLQAMTDKQLDEKIKNIVVYARVSPSDKIRIVQAWERAGQVVAMTGDGVNDAPALKAADIGCAMGNVGTDVAKDTADMILTDDNFSTIVRAVKQGRGVYENIKRVLVFLLGCNIGEILVVFFAMLVFIPLMGDNVHAPLGALQILWINLITDSLPAIALGTEKIDPNVMFKTPTRRSESIFANFVWLKIILLGVLIGGLSLAAYSIGFFFASDLGINVTSVQDQIIAGSTMAFIVLGVSQLVHVYNLRKDKSIFTYNPFNNKYLNGAVLISFLLVALVIFIPQVADVFSMKILSWQLYLVALGLCLSTVLFSECIKPLINYLEKIEVSKNKNLLLTRN